MSDIEKTNQTAIEKYSEIAKNLEFCDDFGDTPVLMAHFTRDRSLIGVLSLLGGFIAMAGLGIPGALFVAFAAFNDLSYTGKDGNEKRVGEDREIKLDEPIAAKVGDDAIEVRSETVPDSQNVLEAAKPSMQHIVSPVWNPAQDLGENPQSALIVGTPGSGKGILVSNAIRVLKAKVPNLTVMMIDPKGDPKERGYWEPVTDIFESFALMDCLDPDEGAEWLLRCMIQFQKLPAPKLLIFDELLAASIELEMADKSMKALPKLKKFMAGIVAQGDSKGVYVWAMSQSPQCADLGLNGGVRGNLRIIAIVSPKNKTAIQVITSTKLVPMVDGGMDELDKIMDASPVGRAVFDGKIARWLPMPKLENHSGFDRDNRSLGDEKPTQNLEDVFSPEFFNGHPLLEKSEPWVSDEAIEVSKIEAKKPHLLSDKFNRLDTLMEGKESLPIREIQRTFSCLSEEAQQIAQMFCFNKKSTYRFSQSTNSNGTLSKSVERL